MTITSIGNDCTGCSACANVCPNKAILMRETSEGFLAPTIYHDRCSDCGLCYRKCPHNIDMSNDESGIKAYLATSSDSFYYLNSATIGLCTIMAKLVIESGGIVFGAELDEKDWCVRHIGIEALEDLDKIRNSKYVQSDINDSYNRIKSLLLKTERLVLFIGTPCQVAGLKSFLGKSFANLLTIDLICHGVYSHKLLRKEVEYWQSRYHGKISNFRFRSKRIYPWIQGGVINFDLKKRFKTRHIEIPGSFSPTYRCYAYSQDGVNYNLRTSCYKCDFRSKGRYGDMTVGDAWFMQEFNPELFNESNCSKGISLFFVNTDNGRKWVRHIRKFVNLYDVPKDYMYLQPAMQPSCREIPAQREILYDSIDHEDYCQSVNRILNVDMHALYLDHIKCSKGSIASKMKREIYRTIKKLLPICS